MFLCIDYNGEPIGPARVWLKHDNVPGLAMARSMGDSVAGSVGVIAEPGNDFIGKMNVLTVIRNLGLASTGGGQVYGRRIRRCLGVS